MKAREPRRKVLVRARLRLGANWSDVTIRNMSSRGLMAQADAAPAAGSYVEIRRGRHIIIGRIAWSAGSSFGLRTQDRMEIDAIVNEVPVRPPDGTERRADPGRRATPAERLEASRRRALLAQRMAIGLAGAGGASFAAYQVFALLSRPLDAVSRALGG